MGTASRMTHASAKSLLSGFQHSCEIHAQRPAVELPGSVLSYDELRKRALSLAVLIQQAAPPKASPLTAVFAHRSASVYTGVLAALFAGQGYVPLNHTFPVARTRMMLLRSGCRSLIVDAGSEPQLEQILEGVDESLLIILPERTEVSLQRSRWSKHVVLGARDLEPDGALHEVPVSPDSIACLLFTPHRTGVPKGIVFEHQNLTHFINFMANRYEISKYDRFAQSFDLTCSAFDMFVAWERGACVCCPSQKTLINPTKFIQNSKVTVWLAAPSLAVFMKRLGGLKMGQFPTLRWSLFCGEPLPADIAESWSLAAPNSLVENLYGPPEATIACCLYRWDNKKSKRECLGDLVPIGEPFPHMEALIVDEELVEVASGSGGELLLAGPQLTPAYWQDAEATAEAFVVPLGKNQRYYRTGVPVCRLKENGPIYYLA
jgi:non-ribosomal peptide synthetase component F